LPRPQGDDGSHAHINAPSPPRRFYIGCDLCSNWFHGVCVGITEKEAKKLEDFVCNDCKRGQEASGQEASGQEASGQEASGQEASGQEASSEELYCICRTPYDESQ